MINEEECIAAGVDPKRVASIARRLRRLAREMGEMGIYVFGGSGSGSLRYNDNGHAGALVLADISSNGFDGGDGAIYMDDAGLERGE